jgi:hypothetical protein
LRCRLISGLISAAPAQSHGPTVLSSCARQRAGAQEATLLLSDQFPLLARPHGTPPRSPREHGRASRAIRPLPGAAAALIGAGGFIAHPTDRTPRGMATLGR